MNLESTRLQEISELIARCMGFEWDAGNSGKNLKSHKVSDGETEEVFFARPIRFSDDIKHSQDEVRYLALGKTTANRLLFLSFTIRRMRIRVISARDMNARDKRNYAGEKT